MQVSESGVHRPPVGGVAGTAADGAYSLVLSGGYVGDVDTGDTFIFTGSGGKDRGTGNIRFTPTWQGLRLLSKRKGYITRTYCC